MFSADVEEMSINDARPRLLKVASRSLELELLKHPPLLFYHRPIPFFTKMYRHLLFTVLTLVQLASCAPFLEGRVRLLTRPLQTPF